MKIKIPKLTSIKIRLPKFTPWMAWIGGLVIPPCRWCGCRLHGLVEGSFVDQPDRHCPLGLMDHHRSFVHCSECRSLQPVCSGVPARSQAIPASCPHGNVHRFDRLHHGSADPNARYRPPGPLLAFVDLLEQAFPALGSDHVRDFIPGCAGIGSNAHFCQISAGCNLTGPNWPRRCPASTILHHIWQLPAWHCRCCTSHRWELFTVCLKSRPLWYRPDISVLFIISAIAGGMALTVFASMLSARITRHANVENNILDRVSQIIGWVLVVYLYFRFWDALSMTYTYEPGRTEGLRLLTSGPLSFNFWISRDPAGSCGSDHPTTQQADTRPPFLAHAGTGIGGRRSGSISLGY